MTFLQVRMVIVLFIALIFFILSVVMHVIQILCLLIYPISKKYMLILASFPPYVLWLFLQCYMEKFQSFRIWQNGDPPKYGESAIVISNHCSAADFLVIHHCARKFGMLRHCKYFVKESVKTIPIYGLGMWIDGFVFLKRNWNKDAVNVIKQLLFYAMSRLPVWFVMFVEGHRFNEKAVKDSNQFLMDKYGMMFKNVLCPRTKGFVTLVGALRNSHIHQVVDITIGYKSFGKGLQTPPPLWKQLLFDMSNECLVIAHTRVFQLSDLPTDEEELGAWLLDRFKEKEKLIEDWKTMVLK